MKKLVLAVLTLVLGSSSLQAQKIDPPGGDSALKTELVAQVDAFMDAWKMQNAAALTATMAPEFLYASPTGVASREAVVGALTHVCTLASYSLSDVRILHISADAVALVYRIDQSASCAGHPDSPVVLNTDTLVHRNGKWLFLMTTSTPVQ
jgi:limonene-1,2-epoxide hydrolase